MLVLDVKTPSTLPLAFTFAFFVKIKYLCNMKPLSADAAMARAAALCSRSEQAESDILKKLLTWGIAPSLAHGVVERLKQENFLNEERYAHAYVHDKLAYNGWGRVKISYQLKMKGISSSAIDAAMEQIDEESYRDTLMRLLQGKWREVAHREPQLARAAMLRYGASRGFETPLLYDAVDKIVKDVD